MSERTRALLTGLPADAVTTKYASALAQGWSVLATEPDACADPTDLTSAPGLPKSAEEVDRVDPFGGAAWHAAVVPGTVAQAVGPEELDRHADYDAKDWWYHCAVPGPGEPDDDHASRVHLRLDGLATLAEVWFNGERVLESDNMFRSWEVDVTDLVRAENEIVIAFRSLGRKLSERHPRPRWKTNLVDGRNLRWYRTTLLGRIPGWTPAIPPVGPWRPVWLERIGAADLESLQLGPRVEGRDGVVEVDARLVPVGPDVTVDGASLRIAEEDFLLDVESDGDGWRVTGTARVEAPELWWPATHGDPALHECSIRLDTSEGRVVVDCGEIGFRDIRIDRTDGTIRFVVNGEPVFCRGACWTTNDIVSLVGDPEAMSGKLRLLADANANMVRVGGTMVYESDDFYRTCDRLGLMVWQDFMFANMDYPVDDEAFASSIAGEAEQQLRRLSRHPSVVAYCGGSEVEQQAAMFGAPREIWSNEFFSTTLPSLVEAASPGAPYWPSTPTGGVLPFHVGEGLTHYYGVGAYKRPLDAVRTAGVKFSPECLGFSHVPEVENLRGLTPHGAVPPHHPEWKRGVPRDTGPGWDFEDIRDHYLELSYGFDPVRLRSEDLERYLALSRIVTGEVLAHVYSEWRSRESVCGGGLVWFMNDFRPGAGWGLIDSYGRPKGVLHHLGRAWAPRCVRLLDRGLDGVSALVVNESADPLKADLELLLIGRNGTVGSEMRLPIEVDARSSVEQSVEGAFGYFLDSTYSYRFGPPRHEATVARLVGENDRLLSEDVHRPSPWPVAPADGLTVETGSRSGERTLVLTSESMVYDVRIDARYHTAAERHFSLAPARPKTVRILSDEDAEGPLRGYVEALNLPEPLRFSED